MTIHSEEGKLLGIYYNTPDVLRPLPCIIGISHPLTMLAFGQLPQRPTHQPCFSANILGVSNHEDRDSFHNRWTVHQKPDIHR